MEIRRVVNNFTHRLTKFFKGETIIITDEHVIIITDGTEIASSFNADKYEISSFDLSDIRQKSKRVNIS